MVRLALLRLLESYFRHRWLYVLPILLTGIAAGLFAVNAVPKYSSGGMLFVQNDSLVNSLSELPQTASGGSWWSTPADTTKTAITDLLKTEAFVRALIQGTSLEAQMNSSPEEAVEVMNTVNEAVWVQSAGNNLISFGFTLEDPQLALQLANRLPENFMTWKLNSSRQDSVAAQEFFGDIIKPYQQELDTARAALERYLEDYPEPIRGERPVTEELQIERLKAEVSKAEQRVLDTQAKEESARLAQTQTERNMRQNYIIIDAPREPNRPVNGLRARAMSGAIFVVVGVFLSVVAVVGGAVIDRSLRFPIDTHQWLHLPVLAMPPQSRRSRRRKASTPVFNQQDAPQPEQGTAMSSQPLAAHSSRE